jgi:ataxia telangiectasia mutated family protein
LAAFNANSSTETVAVLGMQLQVIFTNNVLYITSCTSVNLLFSNVLAQLLVPKLVTCCLPNDKEGGHANGDSSKVLSLLRQLTIDADPLMSDYIRVRFVSTDPLCI